MVSSQSVCDIFCHIQLQVTGYFLIFETILCELYNTNNHAYHVHSHFGSLSSLF